LLDVENPHLFVFSRFDNISNQPRVLVIANFDKSPQALDITSLRRGGFFQLSSVQDLYSGESFSTQEDELIIPPLTFYWIQT